MAGAFFKLFILILSISVMLRLLTPDVTATIDGDFFDTVLQESEHDDQLNKTLYELNRNNTAIDWNTNSQQETGFFQKVFDVVGIVQKLIITILNMAILPISLAFVVKAPFAIDILVFLPIAILYMVSASLTLVRGVNA